MEQLQLLVANQAQEWVSQAKPLWRWAVLATFGSVPRGSGAMLVALSAGENRGVLSVG